MAFRLEVEDGIATITLDRPEAMNTLTRASAIRLARTFDRTDADDAVRAVILTGAGSRAFCAGADLSGGSFGRTGEDDGEDPARDWGGILTMRMFASVKPVIAAVNGVAAGVGATMTLPCDARLAAASARFGFVFARRGIIPESGSTWFLPRLVGMPRALDWCYSGRLVPADEAHAGGLVQAVHPPEALLPAARALARSWIDGTAPVSVALTRRLMWDMLAADHPMTAHRAESAMIPFRGQSADAREGVAAFMEKRVPVFPDKVSAGLPTIDTGRPGGAAS